MLRKPAMPLVGVMLLSFMPSGLTAATGFLVHNLVADVAGMADFTDPNAVNVWGIAISGASPFWVCDGGTGLSTVYTTTGSVTTTKAIIPPSSSGGNTVCTGIVQNSSTAFGIGPAPVRPASFIFATEGGTISGWANAVDPTKAQMAVDNSGSGAVYKGLAILATGASPQLYAANFHTGAIDVFDGNFKPVTLPAGSFTDPAVPAGFAPFNIQNLGGKLYVTYAKQDAAKVFDVQGAGNGHVAVFDTTGKLIQHLVSGGPLNSPWGVQIAPNNFGNFPLALLVGNFGDGMINAFDPVTGVFLGALKDTSGANIKIPGLWGLQVGNGGNGGDASAVYFSAGPGGQKHGLFGSIQANPVVTSAGVINAAMVTGAVAPNTYISIFGSNLAATNRLWTTADFKGNALPTSLDGVTVTINNQPAYVYFISPKQVNVLTPADMPAGSPVLVQVTNNSLNSTQATVPTQLVAPSFFLIGAGAKYIAATHANGALVGATTLFPNASTPAKPGEVIILYGNGFGPTNPAIANGQVINSPAPLAATPVITFGGISAQIAFAGQSATGLYQFNVTVPASVPDGDAAVVATIGGISSPTGSFITVQR